MSIPSRWTCLRAALRERPPVAYLLTVSDDGSGAAAGRCRIAFVGAMRARPPSACAAVLQVLMRESNPVRVRLLPVNPTSSGRISYKLERRLARRQLIPALPMCDLGDRARRSNRPE
jgi:hypothetical protein